MRCGIITEKNQLWIKIFDDSPFQSNEDEEESHVIIINKSNVPMLIKQLKEAVKESSSEKGEQK